MEPVRHTVDDKIIALTTEELDELFYVFKTHIDLFAKIMPPTPLFTLLKEGKHDLAYAALKHFHATNQ